jgi:hypothetical protein
MALPVKISSSFGVLKYCWNRNSKSQISNIKQITMTEIVRASLGLPALLAGPQFQNSKPVFCFGHLVLEFEICL